MRVLLVTFIVLAAVTGIAAQKPDSSKTPTPKPEAPKTEKLPAAKDVLEKYVKAIGGRDALQKHKTRYVAGTVLMSPMGLKGTVEVFSRYDNRSLTKVTIDGVGDILDGYDGTTAWTTNPIQGSRTKQGRELKQTIRTNTYGREWMMDKIYKTVTVKGSEKVGEKDAWVIVLSSDDLPDDIVYFDKETGLMLRSDTISVTPEGEQAVKSYYDDYRDVDGIKVPFKIRAVTPAFELSTTATEVKFDVPMEDSKFIQPK